MPPNLRRTRPAALTAPCPYCQAAPGARCTSPRGRTLTTPHPSRTTAAKENP
ncbi:zinc finger domain-containing protein [Streptomyces sp. NPDC002067]